MIGYGGGTGSPKQIAQLAEAGFGMMLGPTTPKSTALRYALDNGAFPCWLKKRPWDEAAFMKLLDTVEKYERKPDFGCCPDIVAGGLKSLEFSLAWMERLPSCYPWYLAVQDGMTEADVSPALPRFAGLFVGGSTDWKMSSSPIWVRLAHQNGKPVHIGRVNTVARALTVGKLYGADSFDGNNWNRTWSRCHTKDGKPIYRGRTIRCVDTAKPLDVVNDHQGTLDLWGIGGVRASADSRSGESGRGGSPDAPNVS